MNAFAIIVDINGFTAMVEAAESEPLIPQYVRDVLVGGVEAIEAQGGEVVAFMGDAYLGIVPKADQVCAACFMIAKDVDRQCEYISGVQAAYPDAWACSPGGPSLSIGVEHGWIDVSEVWGEALGTQKLFIGSPINYAHRISQCGEGNRCHVGPKAAELIRQTGFEVHGPHVAPGKKGEPGREYYEFDLGDIWLAGPREPGDGTYWG